MKYFNVTVTEKGKKRIESLYANNKREAVSIAKEQFPKVMVIKATEGTPPLEDIIKNFLKNSKKQSTKEIPIDDKVAAIKQISVMTDAGIPINDSLFEVAENSDNKELGAIFLQISNEINAGKTLGDAFKPHGDQFGHIAVAMTELGEQTGNLSGAYKTLAEIMENQRDNAKKFKKAMKSPRNTLISMGIAFTVLIMVVVPKFKSIFAKLKTELPIPTQILLWLEDKLSHYGIYILVGFIVALQIFKFLYRTNTEFKFHVDTITIHPKFYIIHDAIFYSSMYNYNLVFSELIKAGIPVTEALETSVSMIQNLAIKRKLLTVNANIGRGMSLGEALILTGLYENMLLQMIKAGEKGGQLDEMLIKVTEYYKTKFAEFIDNLSSAIEPIMMFFIANLVLLMALGIFMPMWGMGDAAGK
ncbi:Type II secretion system protein [hydrothermal vent metagenome]|uniref:Type II secretion system protein n=1 Tax=hydrothermal vent metagenome TaxID=652676 RepID=A0A1W1C214_9ZZZZ